MKFEWEKIYVSSGYSTRRTWRAKIWNGWLVKSESWDEDLGQCESMVFVPDEDHEWEIEME